MHKDSSKVEKSAVVSNMFIAQAIDMSWRLAIVVLVPVIGGVQLDKVADSSPWLTILGFVLALGGIVVVMRRTVQEANKAYKSSVKSKPSKEKHA